MATQKKPLSIKPGLIYSSENSSENNSENNSEQAESAAELQAELQAEYQQRQRSPRPLPASIAKAYEVLIARKEPEQQSSQDSTIGQGRHVTS